LFDLVSALQRSAGATCEPNHDRLRMTRDAESLSQKIRENQYPGAPKQPRLLRGVPMEIWLVETATIISGIAALIYIVQVLRGK